MLGLTVACARCHDHKYDPILAKDYYALGGVFASSTYKEYSFVPDSEITYWHQKFEKQEKFDEAQQLTQKNIGDSVARAFAAQTSPYMVAAWQVSGAGARDLLARVVPIDLAPSVFQVGGLALTRAGHLGVRVSRTNTDTYEIAVTRSTAADLLHALKVASLPISQ